jgi:hypothetical protein
VEPVDVMVWVGAIIALAGLLMVLVVFVLEQIKKHYDGTRATAEAGGWAEIAEKFLAWIKEMVAKPYRTGVAVMVIGGVIMGAGLYLQNREEDDEDDTPGTTTTQTTTG